MRVPTPNDATAQQVVAIAEAAIRHLWQPYADHQVVGVGVAVPGLVRESDGLIRLAPHLGWVDEPFTELLADALALPVTAANDATLGVRAERTFGAGRGIRDLIYLNGGASGIGAGIIAGGMPLTGAGYAGELGHTLVNSAGVPCHCGATGCLETEVRRAPLLELTGLRPDESDELGVALAASSSPSVHAEVDRQLGLLAVALRNAVNTLNPEMIILGGFLADLAGARPERLEALLAGQAPVGRALAAARENLRIVTAELGSTILMVGAAELAFGAVLANPSSMDGHRQIA